MTMTADPVTVMAVTAALVAMMPVAADLETAFECTFPTLTRLPLHGRQPFPRPGREGTARMVAQDAVV